MTIDVEHEYCQMLLSTKSHNNQQKFRFEHQTYEIAYEPYESYESYELYEPYEPYDLTQMIW